MAEHEEAVNWLAGLHFVVWRKSFKVRNGWGQAGQPSGETSWLPSASVFCGDGVNEVKEAMGPQLSQLTPPHGSTMLSQTLHSRNPAVSDFLSRGSICRHAELSRTKPRGVDRAVNVSQGVDEATQVGVGTYWEGSLWKCICVHVLSESIVGSHTASLQHQVWIPVTPLPTLICLWAKLWPRLLSLNTRDTRPKTVEPHNCRLTWYQPYCHLDNRLNQWAWYSG